MAGRGHDHRIQVLGLVQHLRVVFEDRCGRSSAEARPESDFVYIAESCDRNILELRQLAEDGSGLPTATHDSQVDRR